MKIEGEFEVEAPRTEVWKKIQDPQIMGACIPGCDSIEQLDDTSYRAQVSVKVGPIKARFNLLVEVLEEQPEHTILSRTSGEEGTRASVVNSDNVLRLADTDSGGTRVDYVADVSVTGRLGKFGLGIFRKKADQLAGQFVENFREKLGVTA
ncbi:CoxG family protein [Tropicimonas sp. IMCC34011]|uniref:CoxG family protein n=1 Tax=Tropicimonas sp. IMCC34011 TaxID=2248759 RepID=UPI000E271050|nr:carbon monoxide dehydrogenase subunit G [Tropicimonas sp. IMCC34011]